ncbi:MAG: ECF transporter S component [Oscillospiraceae bacterium]|nr:ECF transporter S component [Oscillospiraceae bacterium]
MKKSTSVSLLVFFLLIPATLFLGTKLPGRSYYITSTLIILQMLLPFFLAFEGRKPQARELVVIAVMCGISIVSRVAIPIPHFKPTFAMIMLSGIAFGPEAGFMVGAVTAFGSNFFVGQGAYTPWQMMAYGAGGLLSGFLSQKGWLSRKPIYLAIFGFLSVLLWVGPLLDLCSLFLMPIGFSKKAIIAVFASGLPANLMQAGCTAAVMLLVSRPLLERLDRIKLKYGMLENHDKL